jgi:hypothetical protein
MPLSNNERQTRWRERHIAKRRRADRVASLLVRGKWPEGHIEELARLLRSFFNEAAVRVLRRALKPITKEENAAILDRQAKQWREDWLREHPGRTAAEYQRLLRDSSGEVWKWRRAKGKASIDAEQRDWERDHPGEEYPEHECGLSDRERTDLERWRRQRARARVSARPSYRLAESSTLDGPWSRRSPSSPRG